MKKASYFSLADQDNNTHTLDQYAGKWLILYFYPQDDTPLCTKEACGFRDAGETLADLSGAVVLGVSKDTAESHKKFIDKYNLNFNLLSDQTLEVSKSYGAWDEKNKHVLRNTYIINPNGIIAKEYSNVTPETHIKTLIEDLRQLQIQRLTNN